MGFIGSFLLSVGLIRTVFERRRIEEALLKSNPAASRRSTMSFGEFYSSRGDAWTARLFLAFVAAVMTFSTTALGGALAHGALSGWVYGEARPGIWPQLVQISGLGLVFTIVSFTIILAGKFLDPSEIARIAEVSRRPNSTRRTGGQRQWEDFSTPMSSETPVDVPFSDADDDAAW